MPGSSSCQVGVDFRPVYMSGGCSCSKSSGCPCQVCVNCQWVQAASQVGVHARRVFMPGGCSCRVVVHV